MQPLFGGGRVFRVATRGKVACLSPTETSECPAFPDSLILAGEPKIVLIYHWLIFQSHRGIKIKDNKVESKCAMSKNSQKIRWDD